MTSLPTFLMPIILVCCICSTSCRTLTKQKSEAAILHERAKGRFDAQRCLEKTGIITLLLADCYFDNPRFLQNVNRFSVRVLPMNSQSESYQDSWHSVMMEAAEKKWGKLWWSDLYAASRFPKQEMIID